MRTTVDIGTLIETSPEIRKGRPCIAGTGVTVRRIVGWYNLGLAPEEIAAKMEHLTLAQIHAALAYYHVNRGELDADIAAKWHLISIPAASAANDSGFLQAAPSKTLN